MNSILNQVVKPKKTFREAPSESSNRFPFARWSPIPLRLIVGYGFMVHGFAKLARGPDAFATILRALGNLLYVACLAALVLRGSGPLSIDGALRRQNGDAGKLLTDARETSYVI